MRIVDLVIIGGGSAGMAAALQAQEDGCRDILILERDREAGGILLQCIHNGFGLHTFQEELSGPAYAERFQKELWRKGIRLETEATVLHLSADKRIEYVSPTQGYQQIQARSVILAMGCRERTRGAIQIPGTRPAGIWTAGTAQHYLNLDGYLPGRKVFILGSGDIGLIMARRMTLEGAQVLGVAELMPYSNGLPRNLKQCLEDFEIPLYLSHTVTRIYGKNRLEAIELSRVDADRRPIPGTQKRIEADTLLLSVGLIPENELSEEAGIVLHPVTKGPVVNESLETSVRGIFACGNVLHVHDLVDFVTAEGRRAGKAAAAYLHGGLYRSHSFSVETRGSRIGYVLPAAVCPDNLDDTQEFCFRVTAPGKNGTLKLYRDGILWKEIRKPHVAPAEMEKLVLKKKDLASIRNSLTLELVLPETPAAPAALPVSAGASASPFAGDMACIGCPMSCQIHFERNAAGEITALSGYTCPRGEAYARAELTHPVRTLTSTAAIEGAPVKRLPVITSAPIPRERIRDVMDIIHRLRIPAPVSRGDVVLPDVCGLGVDLLASRSLPAAKISAKRYEVM